MISRIPPAESAPAVPRKIVASLAEHLFPDAARGREVAALKRDALHLREHVVGRRVGLDDERLDGLAKKTRLRLHAAVILPRKPRKSATDHTDITDQNDLIRALRG